MEKEIYLNPERAYTLEKEVMKRMPEGYEENIMSEAMYLIATRAAIRTLQEYEKMKAKAER